MLHDNYPTIPKSYKWQIEDRIGCAREELKVGKFMGRLSQ